MASGAVESTSKKWKNHDGEEFSYALHVGDVRTCQSFLEKQEFTLAVADIPYGYNAPGAENDDNFLAEDVYDMVKSFAASTTTKLWRFEIFHSLEQSCEVMEALQRVCNCNVEAGIWRKTNVLQMPAGPRLAWGFENWTIGYYSESGKREKKMYNFGPKDSRCNVIDVPCVTKKYTDQLGAVVNPYKKPIALSAWFVNHFSEKGEWVADFYCGTGSTILAALLAGRHGVAIDKGTNQIEYVKDRIMTLDATVNCVDEAREMGPGPEGQEIQPPIGDEEGGTIGLFAQKTIEVVEEVEEANGEDDNQAEENEAGLQSLIDN